MKVLKQLLEEELYSVEEYDGATISTERAFFIYCDIVIRYDYKTGDLVWNNFVRMQFDLVEHNKMVCYMAARGHGKTFFLGLYVGFKMYLLQYFDVGYCSNIPRQRRRFLKLCEALIDTNEMLLDKKDRKRVASKDIPWGTDEMEYNDGLLEGTTVGTTPRGGHYNLAIGDDPLRDDKKYTYEFVVNYFQGVFKQCIGRKKGRYIIVGTPQDPEDLFHVLMNSKLDKNNRILGKVVTDGVSFAGFQSRIFPGILNEERKEVLVPEQWSFEELVLEKERIGEIRFNREILCSCATYRNALIGTALFRSCCDESFTMIQKGDLTKKYVCFVDPATSDAPTADFCSMAVFEDDRVHNKFILRHLFHEKGYPITDPEGGCSDQTNKVIQINRDFNRPLIIIEKNNAGVALIQAVRAKGIEVLEHVTAAGSGREGASVKTNDIVEYVEQGLKAGVMVFPSNSDDNYTVDCLERVKTEHLNFGVRKTKTGEKYEALAGHDDIFTSCWGAFKHRGDMVETLPYGVTVPGGI